MTEIQWCSSSKEPQEGSCPSTVIGGPDYTMLPLSDLVNNIGWVKSRAGFKNDEFFLMEKNRTQKSDFCEVYLPHQQILGDESKIL